jgi:hypothetical protein
MPSMRSLIAISFLVLSATAVSAQMTPEDLKKLIDQRSGNLSGFQELLDDPDPRRSLAAVEGMLASGDSNLERMALGFALTNPDAALRATALEHHFAKLPAIAVVFDATGVKEEEKQDFIEVIKSLGGTIAPDDSGSFNYQPGAFKEEIGCYPHASAARICAMRMGRGFVSLYFYSDGTLSGRWVNFAADETGVLRGGVNLDNRGKPAGTIPLSIRLSN